MNKSKVDAIFSENVKTEFSTDHNIPTFSFNETVASVFDDMIARSIPGYDEVQKLTELLALKLELSNDDIIYDLGCSTGTSLVRIAETLKNNTQQETYKLPQMIGIDNSAPMIEKLTEKLKAHDLLNDIQAINNSIIDIELQTSKLIISHYTLQFINPELRLKILKRICSSLCTGGYFIFSEKVKHESEEIEALITDSYYRYKAKNGYSKTEIMRKRAALENFLRPFTINQNLELLKSAGFSEVDVVGKELCFVTMICRK